MRFKPAAIRGALIPVALALTFSSPALAAGADEAAGTFAFLALALIVARLAGFIERYGQPAVLGELLAGVVLGNLGIGFLEGMRHDAAVRITSLSASWQSLSRWAR